ncbi:MAG: hypothetical protein ACR2MS_06895 [Weeksellaceae bacterium]
MGAITAGLNHVRHYLQQKLTIWKELEEAGYNPHGKPIKKAYYAQKMLMSVKSLKELFVATGKRIVINGEILNDKSLNGRMDRYTGNLQLSDSGFTFSTNTTLALVLYHESMHYFINYYPSVKAEIKGVFGTNYREAFEHAFINKRMYENLLDYDKIQYNIYTLYQDYLKEIR